MTSLSFLIVLGVCYLAYQCFLSLGTGWYRLEKLYRTEVRMPGRIGHGPIRISEDYPDGHLRTWVTLTPAPEGLYLSMPWLLSLMCPPLLIPWKDFVLAPKVELKSENALVKLYLRDADNLVVYRQEYLAMEPYLRHLPHRPVPMQPASARIS